MTEYKAELGQISRFDIGLEDHGIFGFNIDFDFGGSHQGTGWYNLQNSVGGPFLKELLNFFTVNDFTRLKGKYVFALRDASDHNYGYIRGLRRTPQEGGKELIFMDAFNRLGTEKE